MIKEDILDLKNRLNLLKDKVDGISIKTKETVSTPFKQEINETLFPSISIKKFTILQYIMYILIPFIIGFILYMIEPEFIMDEDRSKLFKTESKFASITYNNDNIKEISWLKLIAYTLCISFVIEIILLGLTQTEIK